MNQSLDKQPALFIPVQGKWISGAFEYFKEGRDRLYFYTDSYIGQATDLGIKNVYFKLKGGNFISAKADFIDILESNPAEYRLPGPKAVGKRYYYGYRNLKWLLNKVGLSDLKYFKTGTNLRNDIPGACIIIDPQVE